MSKGIGKAQQTVLDELNRCNRALSVLDIAGADEYGDWITPSNSKVVSLRRAVRSLEKRGLVKAGLARIVDFGRIESIELFCWLPDHTAPREVCKPKVSSAIVEAAVIKALERNQADEYENKYNMKDGFYKYEAVTNQALKLLSAHYDDDRPARVAIKRAVTKLFKENRVQVRWRRAGINGWIRLSVAQ